MVSSLSTAPKLNTTPDEAAPTTSTARIESLDVLRGIAVLMIFVVNVKMMANGYNHYVHRSLWDGALAEWIAFVQGEFVHGRFVTIFTALFGAGLALLLARDKPMPMIIVLRRLFWLIVFGGLHLIFLREGDILIWYALAGFVAIAFVNLGGVTLLFLGLTLQIVAHVYYHLFPIDSWSVPILWSSALDAHLQVTNIMLSGVEDQISARIDAAPYYVFGLFIAGGGWINTLSIMVIGMGLLKTGFLGGKLSVRNYTVWGTLGFAIAAAGYVLPSVLEGDSGWEGATLVVVGSAKYLAGALTWTALIVGLVAAGWRPTAFAAVGRTAFTVYILQSVIGLALFTSLGLGLFGHLSLASLMLVTAAVWVFFLIAAPLWLARFRFGPLEWIWRSLTYGTVQPMRKIPM